MFVTLGVIGGWEIAIIVLIVILLFGAKKIPELMRGAGRGIKEFKDAVNKDYSADSAKPQQPADGKKAEE